jgi:tRNA-dihydrouridine synthase A
MAEVGAVCAHIAAGLDGVMLGRAVYHRPALLAEIERALIDPGRPVPEPWRIVQRLVPYARDEVQRGVRLHSITRHLHGLMAGCAGARAWRRFLSDVATRPDAAPESLFSALSSLEKGVGA